MLRFRAAEDLGSVRVLYRLHRVSLEILLRALPYFAMDPAKDSAIMYRSEHLVAADETIMTDA